MIAANDGRTAPPLVEMRDISKAFGAVRALAHVNLAIGAGEVLGLVGDNAAGKSTLMKILAGAHRPDAGEILIDGRAVSFGSPIAARGAGTDLGGAERYLARSLRRSQDSSGKLSSSRNNAP